MQRTGLRNLIAVGVIMFCTGLALGLRGELRATLITSGPEKVPEGVDLEPVWKAWRLLEEKYVPATSTAVASPQDRVWGLIEGLAQSYGDPYTVFMPPSKSLSFEQDISGSFGGVGMEIGMRDGILTVIAPLKGTPAEAAGIRAGDLIAEVDGTSTRALTIDEALVLIRGEIGTAVTLTLVRKGEAKPVTVSVVRAQIDVPTLDTELRKDGVFVISLYNFGGTATREMRRALGEFMKSGSHKLVLDLRGNPGGYLEGAVDIASWFLPAGSVVVTEDYGEAKEKIVHRSKGYTGLPKNVSVTVLVDGGSASASEILAGALREQSGAVLIGETTFGKGSVQELLGVTPDTSLKVTVARWLTPKGTSLSAGGLVPDLTVPYSEEDRKTDRDPQLDAAVRYLLSGVLDTATSTTPTTSGG